MTSRSTSKSRSSKNGLDDEVTTHEIKEQLSSVGEELGTLARQFRELTGGQMRNARERAQDKLESGKEAVQDWGEEFSDTIRARPLRSLLIAAGVGALIGFLTRGRN